MKKIEEDVVSITRTYMKGKLLIKVYTIGDDYEGDITYKIKHGEILDWHIPQDLRQIYRDLFFRLDEEVAKIIYEEIEKHYNEILADLGIAQFKEMVTVIKFPDYREFNIIKPRITTNINTTNRAPIWGPNDPYEVRGAYTYADAGTRADSMQYLSAEEYERKRQNGELQSGVVYLVLN